MNADKMFEELGYEINYEDEQSIEYFKGESFLYFFDDKRFYKNNTYGEAEPITMQELKAINKKCKELGWLND